MYIPKSNLTGNDTGEFSAQEIPALQTRYRQDMTDIAAENPYAGGDGIAAGFQVEDAPYPEIEMDPATFYNSRLDLNYDLPSTQNVTRFVCQNKG